MPELLFLGGRRCEQTLFLEGAQCLGANFECYFLAVDDDSLLLQVRFPHFFGVALRKTHVIAKLLAFTSNITYTHGFIPYIQCFILTVFTP